ncbi:MAG: dTDP-4-dehydrorhamnose reductase [Solirubrobacteraceae bacterium]
MELLVTGAAGMLGQDVLAAAAGAGLAAHGVARAELDIRDKEAVRGVLAQFAPDVVINCAAWTDVDGAEAQEAEALAVNGTGAENLARCGVPVVHVSTDYVFDGTSDRPYVESDPTGPRTAYGRTKLAGEEAMLAAGHAVVRTAWLFGHGGKNFVSTMLRLGRERESVPVVADQVGCPTYTGHLAAALVELAQRPERSGLHHIAGAGRCSWNEFARAIFSRAGLHCDVPQTTSAEFARPAPRPAWSVLASEREDRIELATWQDGLNAYLSEGTA